MLNYEAWFGNLSPNFLWSVFKLEKLKGEGAVLIPLEATEKAYGRIETDRVVYRPLEVVTAVITGREQGDHQGL